jgi:hypothetical protein
MIPQFKIKRFFVLCCSTGVTLDQHGRGVARRLLSFTVPLLCSFL